MPSKKAKSKVVSTHVMTDQSIAREAATAIVSKIRSPMPSSEWLLLLREATDIIADAIEKHAAMQSATAKVSPQA